ncbi:Smr/MutS family protein [Sphingomonas sp.]|uniref:Smr/MutS family protein n=1 Tax=Sphingomonas sp. TaxID=28214 RepID=UPI001D591D97|nr:Smr/MutS family protein [Sphingomonas sp.]MBX9796669.1 Smr/MutS family protein [Sphingomonas sp.]
MAGRRLSAEERALWRRVAATVTPLAPAAPLTDDAPPLPPAPAPKQPKLHPLDPPRPRPAPPRAPGVTLDGGWDRRLAKGIVAPDASIDLHGHSLDSAHHLLDLTLERAIRRGDRLLLVITGRPPRADSERPHARGRIRASIADWLAASRHAGQIAAIRPAHPRHGGAGALYLVLRRPRSPN